MGALYLRGKWTVHRNDPEVNTVWRRCAHLGADLQKELGTKVSYLKQMDAAGRKGFPTRFVSAEGCYSYEAVQAKLKFKIALKQARYVAVTWWLHGGYCRSGSCFGRRRRWALDQRSIRCRSAAGYVGL